MSSVCACVGQSRGACLLCVHAQASQGVAHASQPGARGAPLRRPAAPLALAARILRTPAPSTAALPGSRPTSAYPRSGSKGRARGLHPAHHPRPAPPGPSRPALPAAMGRLQPFVNRLRGGGGSAPRVGWGGVDRGRDKEGSGQPPSKRQRRHDALSEDASGEPL